MVSDGADGTIIAKSQTNRFIEKNYQYEFTIFYNKYFMLNMVFDILNF